MTNDQQIALSWIASDALANGKNSTPMPFKLTKFRGVRDSLVRQGLVMKTTTGRYVPVTDKP